MSRYLFPDFETNRAEYERLVSYWHDDIWECVPGRARRHWVTPWFSSRPVELQDGNPIFTAWAPDRRIGLSIIQVPPGTTNRELDHRITWFGGHPPDVDAIRTLTIICVLTDRNWKAIVELVSQWVRTGSLVERKRQIEIPDTRGFMLPTTYRVADFAHPGSLR